MISLDKIKIVAPLKAVTIVDESKFEVRVKRGVEASKSYTQTTPFLLYVEVDYEKGESVLDFTGKILFDKYPQLINAETFNLCIDMINNMGFCAIDKDVIRKYGRVCVVDVTKDVRLQDASGLSEWLRINISNHRKYLARHIGNNLVIEKNVRTRGYKRRLTVYDKEKELQRAENRDFISCLHDQDSLLSYFKGKVRFEYNLNSMEAIRRTLNIQDTSIDEILSSTANPIYNFIDEVITEDSKEAGVELSWTDRKNLALLRDCDMDIAKVEAEIRKYASKGTHISQVLKPYKALMSRLGNKGCCYKDSILGLLLETTVIFPLLLIWM